MAKRGTQAREPDLLVVEDREDAATAMTRFAGQYLPVRVASTCAEAWSILTSNERPAGVILDENVGDESGTAMFKKFRARDKSSLPAMIMTGGYRSELQVDPCALRARFVAKGTTGSLPAVTAFAATVAVREQLDQLVVGWAPPRVLTLANWEIFRAASWVPRADLSDVLGAKESTVRQRLRRLLAHLRVASYEELQELLEPTRVFFARGGRADSGMRWPVPSLEELSVPRDAEGSSGKNRPM
jgi:CheY-like chemotaxis protein